MKKNRHKETLCSCKGKKEVLINAEYAEYTEYQQLTEPLMRNLCGINAEA
jgi:hypothetical protein